MVQEFSLHILYHKPSGKLFSTFYEIPIVRDNEKKAFSFIDMDTQNQIQYNIR